MSDNGLTINGPRNPNVPPGDGEASITLYGYIPALALGVVGVVCFILNTFPNIRYTYKSGRRYLTFHLCLVIGCLVEAAGYAARIHSHYNPFRIDNFVAQFLMIILAPIAFTVSIDITLNMLVKRFPGSDGMLLLRPKLVLIIFVTTDAICNIVQIAGGTLFGISQSGDPREGGSDLNPELGQNVLRAGLALQVASWVIFIAFLGVAIWRANRPSGKHAHLSERRYDPLRWYLWVVLVACILILWRACFRLAEAITGFVSGPLTREDYFGCFEFLPVILCVTVLTALPPYRFIEHPRARETAQHEKRFGSNGEVYTSDETSRPSVV